MDSPVSAFTVYANKKASNQIKKKKAKNKSVAKASSPELRDTVLLEVAQKLKQQKNAKKSEKIIKKSEKVINGLQNHKKKKHNGKHQKKSKSMTPNRKQEPNEPENDVSIFSQLSSGLEDSSDNDEPWEPNMNGSKCNGFSQSSNDSTEFTPVQTDSSEEGLKVFKWMIAPYNPKIFLNELWEKKPVHISRKNPNYYKDIISTPVIDNMLRCENIQYTKNIDVTSYTNGKRETHNPEGRALPHIVWDYYLNGCSIRLLNPQTYIPKLHTLNATLQEFFNSFVGANAYLTPPDSQGFAPHYDDIEAFILQAEGKKQWRVYKPRSEIEVLPRVSSKNFEQDEIGEPVLEVTLEAGDLLYFPRGFIHQGVTIEGEHSLHVTVSMYQKHSWADLFEKMIPVALNNAINENVELRRGLPFDIYDNFGLVNSDLKTPRRQEIEELIKTLFDKIKEHLPIDAAVDQMNKNFQHDALPPVLNDLEKAVTTFGDSDIMIENGKVVNRVEIGLDTKIRLLRKNILRIVSEEEESVRIYFHVENSLEYHGNELSFMEIDPDVAPAIETLINSYPDYVSVESLDIPNDSDKLEIADALWSRGLIMTEYPLENIEDD